MASEPPTSYGYRVTRGSPFRCHHGEIRLRPQGDHTELIWRIRFRPKLPGTGRLLATVLSAGVGRALRAGLKRHVEQLAQQPKRTPASSTRERPSVMASTKSSDKAVMVFGLLTVAAYLTAIVLQPMGAPNSASRGREITAYASAHRSQLLASYLFFAVGLALVVVFAAGLYRMSGACEPEDGWLAMASVASAVGGVGIFGAGIALFMVVAYRPIADPAVVRAFWDAGWLAINTAGFAFVAWITIITVATLRHGALPDGQPGSPCPSAAINFVGPFALQAGNGPFSPQGWYAMVVGLTFAAWLLAVAVAAGRPTRIATTADPHVRPAGVLPPPVPLSDASDDE